MLYTLGHVTEQALKEIREEMNIRRTTEIFLLFSLGSQFDHLIKQAIDKLGVFCLVADPSKVNAEDVKKVNPKGIILSGGPVSVYADPPPFDREIFNLGIPVFGICLGFQLWAEHIGAKVVPSDKREFGVHELKISRHEMLLHGIETKTLVLESHGDRVEPNKDMAVLASTENADAAAANYKNLWGVQFHPEVTETVGGPQIFQNFIFKICQAQGVFPAHDVAERKVKDLRQKIEDKKVLLALSGGSDSSTVAYLLKYALKGKKGQLRAVYIEGIDRPDDKEHVLKYFGNQDWVELVIIDATDKFLEALRGKITMPEKRIAMRGIYKAVLEEEARKFNAAFIAQGTLYTDISESGGGYQTGARKAQIKLHHNVNLGFSSEFEELLPLSDCVKDSGRNIGREIGVPEDLLTRHPFPGPGMVVRIEDEITADKLRIARAADKILIEELRRWGFYDKVWQAGAFISKSEHTCTKGDDATRGLTVFWWAVWSVNGFTAQAADLPYDFRQLIARRMGNEIREVGSVNYRDSCKPPSTIECG